MVTPNYTRKRHFPTGTRYSFLGERPQLLGAVETIVINKQSTGQTIKPAANTPPLHNMQHNPSLCLALGALATTTTAYLIVRWLRTPAVRRDATKADAITHRYLAALENEAGEEEDLPIRGLVVNGEEVVVPDGTPHVVSGEGRMRVVTRAVAYVRAKIGLPKRTAANELVVRRLVSEFLKDLGVRPTHQMRIAPIAVEVSFMPTRSDILARDMAGSTPAVDAREDYHADRIAPGRMGSLGLWFGTRVTKAPTE